MKQVIRSKCNSCGGLIIAITNHMDQMETLEKARFQCTECGSRDGEWIIGHYVDSFDWNDFKKFFSENQKED